MSETPEHFVNLPDLMGIETEAARRAQKGFVKMHCDTVGEAFPITVRQRKFREIEGWRLKDAKGVTSFMTVINGGMHSIRLGPRSKDHR